MTKLYVKELSRLAQPTGSVLAQVWVVNTQMGTHGRRLRETLPAVRTREGPFSTVDSLVCGQVPFLRELPVTEAARERFLSSVYSHMYLRKTRFVSTQIYEYVNI